MQQKLCPNCARLVDVLPLSGGLGRDPVLSFATHATAYGRCAMGQVAVDPRLRPAAAQLKESVDAT